MTNRVRAPFRATIACPICSPSSEMAHVADDAPRQPVIAFNGEVVAESGDVLDVLLKIDLRLFHIGINGQNGVDQYAVRLGGTILIVDSAASIVVVVTGRRSAQIARGRRCEELDRRRPAAIPVVPRLSSKRPGKVRIPLGSPEQTRAVTDLSSHEIAPAGFRTVVFRESYASLPRQSRRATIQR